MVTTLREIRDMQREAELGVTLLVGALRGVRAHKLAQPSLVSMRDLALAVRAVAQQKQEQADRPGWGAW